MLGNLDAGRARTTVDQALATNGLTRDDLNALAPTSCSSRTVEKDLGSARLQRYGTAPALRGAASWRSPRQRRPHPGEDTGRGRQVYQQVTTPGRHRGASSAALAKQDSIDTTSASRTGGRCPRDAGLATYEPEFGGGRDRVAPGEISEARAIPVRLARDPLDREDGAAVRPGEGAAASGKGPAAFNAWLVQAGRRIRRGREPHVRSLRHADAQRGRRSPAPIRAPPSRPRRSPADAASPTPSATRPAAGRGFGPRRERPGARLAARGAVARSREGDGAACAGPAVVPGTPSRRTARSRVTYWRRRTS